MRRIGKCVNPECGDERELVGNGLCAKCYMRTVREADKRDEPPWASPDRSQRRYIRSPHQFDVQGVHKGGAMNKAKLTLIQALMKEVESIDAINTEAFLQSAGSAAPTRDCDHVKPWLDDDDPHVLWSTRYKGATGREYDCMTCKDCMQKLDAALAGHEHSIVFRAARIVTTEEDYRDWIRANMGDKDLEISAVTEKGRQIINEAFAAKRGKEN